MITDSHLSTRLGIASPATMSSTSECHVALLHAELHCTYVLVILLIGSLWLLGILLSCLIVPAAFVV